MRGMRGMGKGEFGMGQGGVVDVEVRGARG